MLYKNIHVINNLFLNLSHQDFILNITNHTKPSIPKKKTYVKQDDFLFWSFFILMKGEQHFEYIKTQKFITSQEFKINASLKIKSTKFNNRKLVKSKILNNLCHDPNIHLMTLASLCVLYDKNILYCVNNKKYYELYQEDKENINIVINDKGNIEIIKNASKEEIDKYNEHLIKMETYDEKLKSISSYKLIDLQNIASCINVETKNKSKQKLYDEIQDLL